MPLSITQAQAFLNSLLGSGTPATWYLALYLTEPTPSAAGVEVSGGSYARLSIVNDNTKWAGASSTSPSIISNAASFTFATPTTDWGTVGFWGLVNVATNGTPTWFGALASPLVVTSGNPVVISAGNLNLALG